MTAISSDVGLTFHYVYVLVSELDSEKHYTGVTGDLRERLQKHNGGNARTRRNTDHGRSKQQSLSRPNRRREPPKSV
ncbi:MAG: GIY-YIG nuclease family protein [Chthoniobacterales bacterium]